MHKKDLVPLEELDEAETQKILAAPIVKLAQIDPLRVEVIAPVALLGKVTLGATAEVLPEAPVGGVHAAKVTVVDRVVDAASGTL